MRSYSVAVIPGDGIGIEVVAAALPVLHAAGERHGFQLDTTHFPWGGAYYARHGEMMAADGLQTLRGFQAILLGAIGDARLVPDHVSLHTMLLEIRRRFQQYINLRPHRVLAGVRSPLREADFDILCIRENSEGEYVGAGGRAHVGTPNEVAVETAIFTRQGVERVLRFAFEQARQRSRRLAIATKSNAQKHSMVFWDEVAAAVAADYPDVAATTYHVDALCARLITHPASVDVVVASNLFGDILTDVGAAIQLIVQGPGVAATATQARFASPHNNTVVGRARVSFTPPPQPSQQGAAALTPRGAPRPGPLPAPTGTPACARRCGSPSSPSTPRGRPPRRATPATAAARARRVRPGSRRARRRSAPSMRARAAAKPPRPVRSGVS